MRYTIENEVLRLTVDAHGAETVSVIDKKTGAEMLWCGDPAVWGRHAPLLFPYTGRLTGGKFIAKGKTYEAGAHGFARDQEFALKAQTADTLTLELLSNEKTLALFPYAFALTVHFALDGKTLRETVSVKNPGEENLQFGLGFHPAFALPFDDKHSWQDYDLVFDQIESPMCMCTEPHGLVCAKPNYYLARNTDRIPLTEDLFAVDSHCMTGLRSKTLSLVERDTGRSIRVNIAGFPYVLIWSMPHIPMRFVCIEPWNCLPSEENGPLEWEQKPCATRLAPGESWQTELVSTFDRV